MVENKIAKVKKRDGQIVEFDPTRISEAIFKALTATGQGDGERAKKLSDRVVQILNRRFKKDEIPQVEQIQDIVEEVLILEDLVETAKAYILYREQRRRIREAVKVSEEAVERIDQYLEKADWEVQENANMAFSLQGLNHYGVSYIVKRYWLNKIYPKEIREANESGDFHVHNLDTLGPYTFFGQEVVIAKLNGQIKLISLKDLYEEIPQSEILLNERDKAFGKYPENLYILDKNGWTKVPRMVRKKKEREMRFIKSEQGRSVIVTDDHPFIIKEKKDIKEKEIPAKEVQEKKHLILSTYTPDLLKSETLFSKKYLYLAEELINKGHQDFFLEGFEWQDFIQNWRGSLRTQGTLSTANWANSLDNKLELSEDFGYLVGIFIAEGHYDSWRLAITISEKKIIEKIQRICAGLGIRSYVRDKEGKTKRISISCSTLKLVFEKIFQIKAGSKNKNLPPEILTYNLDFVRGVIAGIIDGDGTRGTRNKNGEITQTLIRVSSRTMLEQIAILLQFFGIVGRDRVSTEDIGKKNIFQGKEIVQNYPLCGLAFSKKENVDFPSLKYERAKPARKHWRAEEYGWNKVLNSEFTTIADDFIYDITTNSQTFLCNSLLVHNCAGWDLYDLLLKGFGGVPGKIESRPAKHFQAALGQAVNFLYTLQGETAGAVAFSNFDTLLAPFIRYDNLNYQQVKQALQEFLFNMAIPTRVGFQCVSEDTEILTSEGWKGYDEIKEEDEIKTLNLNTKEIENKKVRSIFKRYYKGMMYRLRNRIQDQLISPQHQVLRRKFNTQRYVLEPIEDILKLKSPIIVPITGKNPNPEANISDEQIKLMAWTISEGTVERPKKHRCCYRVSIYQSKIKNKTNYDEIIGLLKNFNLVYANHPATSLGEEVQQIKLNAESSRQIHKWFGTRENVHFIPDYLLNLSQRQSRLFLETYLRGDSKEGCKIATSDLGLLDDLERIIVNAGYGFTIRKQKPILGTVGKKDIYILRIIRHPETYITKIKKVNYQGIIWCPHTENGTIIARRKGKVFVTGNCPFSNITLDLKPSPVFAKQPVIIGGKPQKETYSEFEEEMKIFDRAFYETMLEGDKSGRPFHFPIPTINITKDFPWEEPAFDGIFKASAKYGTNYFANYINSEMKPEDVRSMCFPGYTKVIYKEGKHTRHQRTTIRNLVNSWNPKKELHLLINGKWVKITDAFKLKNNSGKIIKVTLKNGEVIKMTPDHPAMIAEDGKLKQVLAKDLKKGAIIPIAKQGFEGKLGDFELGRFLGLYISEGGVDKNEVYFSFNEKEKELQGFIKKIAEERFAFPVRITKDPRWDTIQVWVKSRAAVEWVRKFYSGESAPEKHLLSSLYGMSRDFRLGVLVGIYQGDGYERDVEVNTTNKKLRDDIADLARSIGINYTKRVNYENTKGKKKFTSYVLRLCRDTLKELAPYFKNIKISSSSIFKDFGDFYGIKIKSVKIQNYHAPVYDFEVDSKEHLFQLANGVITHNCCRLRLNLTELYNRGGGGLFGSGSKTGCYDQKTEILTEDGWKFFKDLAKENKVFTLSGDNKIELHYPTKLFEYDYQDKMIYFKGKSFDLLVTPNHRMVVDHKYKYKRMFVEAKGFKKWQHYIPKGGDWEGEEKEYFELPPVLIMGGAGPVSHFSEKELQSIRKMKKEGKNIYQIAENFNCNPVTVYNVCTQEAYGNRERLRLRYETSPLKIKMDDWLKFFGFWIAEGYTDNENTALDHGYRVVISQTNKRKRKEIKKVLNVLPFNYYEEKNNFVICNKQLWSYLRQFGNKYQKFIPKEIKFLSQRQLKILFDWTIKGDGHIRKTNGQINYWTSSNKLADDLQEIILKLGWMGTLTWQKKKVTQIKGRKIKAGIVYTLGVQKTKHYTFNKKQIIKEVDYKGKVYCCEVPNHTVCVRRNGKVTWCGNSIGVVTINMPRIGYLSKTKKEFFERLAKVMDLAKESLEIKRKIIENFIEKSLYPYSKFYLEGIEKMRGGYYANHFATIGLVGMNEALLNFIGENIASKRGRRFALDVLGFMRERLVKYQKETKNIYNLEATPAESSLAPNEKVLISQSEPKLTEIGPLIDDYLERNKNEIRIIGRSEVLPLKEEELYTYGFSRKNQKIRKYPVTALIRHPGDSMYEIETVSGRKVKVTKYHSLFTLNEKGIPEEVRVEVLKQGDVIAIPKKIEMENIYQRFNLIEEFKKFPQIKEKLYLETNSDFIEKLVADKRVKAWAKRYYQFAFKDVKYWWQKKKIIPLKLIFDLDISLEKEVLENSKIFYRKSKNTSPIKPLISIDRDLGFVLGIILAEGWIGKDSIEISNTNKTLIEEMSSSLKRIFGPSSFRTSLTKDKRGYKPLFTLTLLKLPTLFLNETLNLKGKSSKKLIPSFAYFSSNEFAGGFLKGFLFGDGNKRISPKNSDYNFRFYTNSRELKEGLNLLLLGLGILAKIRIDRKDKVNPNWKRNYILSISGIKNLQRFHHLVLKKEFRGKLKNSGREKIPKIVRALKDLIRKQGLKKKDLEKLGIWQSSFDRCVRKNSISWHQLKEILEKLEKKIKDPILKALKFLVKSDLYWDPIKSIRKIKTPKYVYDFEVDGQEDLVQNFLGGEGLVCLHNTAYRLALKDKEKYPDLITAGTKKTLYYTNSSQLPVNYTNDIFEALKLQDELQCHYTGGTVLHLFLGERVSDIQTVKNLIKKIFENFRLPYITLTPTFSICPSHGYLEGEHFECPKCTIKQPCEVYSRIVGYYRPVRQYNIGKQQEFHERKIFKIPKAIGAGR